MKVYDIEFEYKDVLNIQKERWKQLLNNSEIFDENSLKIVQSIYQFEDHSANTSELEYISGINHNGINSILGYLAKRVKNSLNINESIFDENNMNLSLLFIIYDTNTGFSFEIRKNLRQAIKEVFPELNMIYIHNPNGNPLLLSEDLTNCNLVDIFLRIGNEYENIKSNENYTGHPFKNEIKQAFNENMIQFLNKYFKLQNIDLSTHFGMGTWITNPWFGLMDKKNNFQNTNYKNGFYLSFFIVNRSGKSFLELAINHGSQDFEYSKEFYDIWSNLLEYMNFIPNNFVIFNQEKLEDSEFIKKVYDLENLDEKSFEQDLRQIITVYEHLLPFYKKIMGDLDMDVTVMKVINNFKEIINEYPKAITEEFKQHPFANKMRKDFTNNLLTLTNYLLDEFSKYDVKISPGMSGNWANIPWAGIRNHEVAEKFTEGLYLIYHFYPEKNTIDFSINQGYTNIQKNLLYDRRRQLQQHLKIIPNGFTTEEDNEYEISKTAILFKKYPISEINETEFKNDLITLLNIYESLIPKYLEITRGIKTFDDKCYKRNVIYFGAPGTGKSFQLEEDKNNLLTDYESNYSRVTFHPDYSYANFVGTYKPVPIKENNETRITYEYVSGPFMRLLVKALDKPSEPFLLIIEEINRANVAAVFGDVFQLLDRKKDNSSRYPIDTSVEMKKYLEDELGKTYEKLKIPSNMFIWATMNSADQGVFPMDTAFKRRWNFKYFGIDKYENKIENIIFTLNDVEISWNTLRKQINKELLSDEYKINEDKLLGPFFAFDEYKDTEITEDDEEDIKDIFKNKIIMYLFEDAVRSKRNELFSGVQSEGNLTYSQVCGAFDNIGVGIFCDNIKRKFINEDGE